MLPLAGSIHALILSVTPVSIHGDMYFDLVLQTAEDAAANRAKQIRVPVHACNGGRPPEVGERVEVQFLMQQVTGVRVV